LVDIGEESRTGHRTIELNHFGAGACLVDEDEAVWIDKRLDCFPDTASTLFDGSHPSFRLTIAPGTIRLGEAVLNAVFLTDLVEDASNPYLDIGPISLYETTRLCW